MPQQAFGEFLGFCENHANCFRSRIRLLRPLFPGKRTRVPVVFESLQKIYVAACRIGAFDLKNKIWHGVVSVKLVKQL